jgi:hypothetical protein
MNIVNPGMMVITTYYYNYLKPTGHPIIFLTGVSDKDLHVLQYSHVYFLH